MRFSHSALLILTVLAFTIESSEALPRKPWYATRYGRTVHAQRLAYEAAASAAAAATAAANAAAAAGAITTRGSTLTLSMYGSAGDLILDNTTGSFGLIRASSGTVTLSGTSALTTALATGGATLNLTNPLTLRLDGGVTFNSASSTFDFSNTPISGALQLTGAGTISPLIADGASTFSGTLTLDHSLQGATSVNFATPLTGTLTTATASAPVSLVLNASSNGTFSLSNGAVALTIGGAYTAASSGN